MNQTMGERVLCTLMERATLRERAMSDPTLSEQKRALVLSALDKIPMPTDREARPACSPEEIASLEELARSIRTGFSTLDHGHWLALVEMADRFLWASRRL